MLVAISQGLKYDLINGYSDLITENDVLVAHDGVDIERFNDLPEVRGARRILGLPEHRFIAGYAGHLYPGKGIETIEKLAKQLPQITFLVAGGEPDVVSKWRKKLKDVGVMNILFCGFVANTELPLYLAACEVLLLPIQRITLGSGGGNIAKWTSPMKLFEYMASRRLIIASDLPVLREILSENNAVLCQPQDINEWKRVLERSVGDMAWRKALAGNAFKDVKQYAWTRRVDKCVGAIRKNLPKQEFSC
jgi:glycosyltransferase involved in cell wall biosynthesis